MSGRFWNTEKFRLLFWTGLVCLVAALAALLVVREYTVERPDHLFVTASGAVDMCLSCHKDEKLDQAHDAKVLGCAPCHLGDPLAITKEAAHHGIVKNPGDLRIADKTCAVEGCHPVDINKVKNSLMATNRGIIGTLLHYWGEIPTQNSELTVEKLLVTGHNSMALDYYRKLCATCHLWKQKNDLPEAPAFFNEKGGGCTACHLQKPDQPASSSLGLIGDNQQQASTSEKRKHPLVTAKVTSEACIRCHNRSGRLGISYAGMFEGEGYGTPYEEGHLSSKQLPDARFYLPMADDIHHRKGMECIDCHTRKEIMGDGTSYAHFEEQVELSCVNCHSNEPGLTRKGDKLKNVDGAKKILQGKVDGKTRPLHIPKQEVCTVDYHKRLTCESCHSTWVPQCNGCHIERDTGKKHLDKLSLKETIGKWQEGRSYIRYERPMLGVWKEKVVIVTPGCQDMVTVVDKEGKTEGGFNRFTMAAINPHTIQEKGRTCVDCHSSPKTVGLGEGKLYVENNQIKFTPIDQGVETQFGKTPGFDTYVTIEGKALQHSSRPDLRPFSSEELQKILRVGRCVGCHSSYRDTIWKKYSRDMQCSRFGAETETGFFPPPTHIN